MMLLPVLSMTEMAQATTLGTATKVTVDATSEEGIGATVQVTHGSLPRTTTTVQ